MATRLFSIVTIFFLIFGCNHEDRKRSGFFIKESDLIYLFDEIEIPRNEIYNIYVVVEEYLNDSSLIINVYQHSVDLKENEPASKFVYQQMDVFLHSELLKNWVPDSYYRRFLFRYRKESLLIEPLEVLPLHRLPEGYEYDSLHGALDKEDFM